MVVAWLAGFCLYQWLYPQGPGWWTRLVAHAHPHALPWGGASLPSFAAAFALARLARLAARRPAYSRARDRAHREPLARPAAGPAAAGRRRLVPRRARATAAARSRAHRRALRRRRPRRAAAAARPPRHAGSLHPGRRRPRRSRSPTTATGATMRSTRSETPGRRPTCPSSRRVRWAHVAPLARGEFPLETLAALARRCRVSLDGQGLVRVPQLGPLRARRRLRPRAAAAHLGAEARRRGGGGGRRPGALGVREVVVTHGSRGSTVYCGGRHGARPRAPDRRRPDRRGRRVRDRLRRRAQRRLRPGRRGAARDRRRRVAPRTR